jgi:hypothetical protein
MSNVIQNEAMRIRVTIKSAVNHQSESHAGSTQAYSGICLPEDAG